jgi:hypothetical protein
MTGKIRAALSYEKATALAEAGEISEATLQDMKDSGLVGPSDIERRLAGATMSTIALASNLLGLAAEIAPKLAEDGYESRVSFRKIKPPVATD